MAEIEKTTDIMLHVQTTDQLSSAMLSHMYNGNVVIAGEWLPYNELREKGIFFISVKDIDDISSAVEEVVNNPDEYRTRCMDNRSKVYAMSSWRRSADDWYETYKMLLL